MKSTENNTFSFSKENILDFSPENMTTKKAFAFTLVELIIVITILAILATIAFVSFQNYVKDSRDAVRVSDLTNAGKGLSIFFTKSGIYPEPENEILILASGSTITNQGKLGESVAKVINLNQAPLDPIDQTKYTYSTNQNKSKYQLMAYTENSNIIGSLPMAFASDISERGIKTSGDELGIVLNMDNSFPTTNVETTSGTTNYKVVFNNSNSLEGSGNIIFSELYNMRDDLLKNKEIAKFDDSLSAYWDMETLTGNLLKDWSKYENNGTCYSNGTFYDGIIANCGENGGSGPQIVSSDTKNGKAMRFNSATHTRIISSTGGLSNQKAITVSLLVKFDSFVTQNGLVFIYNASGQRYLFSSTRKNSGIQNGSHVGTLFSDGNWGFGVGWEDSFYDTNIWYKITYIINPQKGYIKVFRNSELIQHVQTSNQWNFSGIPNNIYIGSNWENSSYTMNGLIDEVRIYNRALSDAEVQTLYASTK